MSSQNVIYAIKILILMALFLAFNGAILHKNNADGITLVDTDCYMRLVRVEALHDTGAWFDNTISRSNAPFGETLHWSRLLDLLLLAGAYPIALILPFHDALFWWGYFISPIFMIASICALSWAARPIFRQDMRVFLVLFFICQAAIMAYYSFGRPDHHSLLLFLFILQIGSTLRILLTDGRKPIYSCLSGAIAAVGMWVSVETLVPVFFAAGTLAMLWVGKTKYYLQALQYFFFSLTICSLLFLLVERPIAQLAVVEYDKISIVHVTSFAMAWIFFRFPILEKSKNKLQKIFALIILGATAFFGLATIFPVLFKGPYAMVAPEVVEFWLSKVLEIQPLSLATRDSAVMVFAFIGSILWILPYSFLSLFGKRKITEIWLFFHFGLFLFYGLAFYQVRWTLYAELIVLFPMVFVLMMLFRRIKNIPRPLLQSLTRITAIFILALGHYLVAWVILSPDFQISKQIPTYRFCKFFDTYEQKETILAWVDFGPSLLFETKHNVIATPYHRNSSGILFWKNVMSAETDEEAYQLLQARSVNYIVLCPQGSEAKRVNSLGKNRMFYNRLTAGDIPAWLQPVQLTDELKDSFVILKVIGGGS